MFKTVMVITGRKTMARAGIRLGGGSRIKTQKIDAEKLLLLVKAPGGRLAS